MSAFDDLWRIVSIKSLAVNSAGGATTSTTSVAAQTRAVELVFPAIVASTTGCRFMISDMAADSITSTTGALLPPNWVQRYKITPGQKVQAISADGSAIPGLIIHELTK